MTKHHTNWNYPTDIRLGAGRVQELAQHCRNLGVTSPLLVTDPGLAALPMVSKIEQALRGAGLASGLFTEVQGNPTGENVAAGVEAYRLGQHDGVIALGGGSALDAGKAVALMAGQNRPLWDFEDRDDNWTRVNADAVAKVIAVPTTAGTGSEVGRAAVITDTEAQLKKIIFHPKMLPTMVILDPELTVNLPPPLTAATGMDALSHNLEAFCAPAYHPMAAGIAVEGIRLVKNWLPTAYHNGGDLEARAHMLVASSMGATAFQKGLGGMHALAHSLGALYNAHHGLLNAILMPYVLQTNRSVIEDRINALAAYLGLTGFDGFYDWVLQLRAELNIPNTLADIGIDTSQAERIGAMAYRDPSAEGNPHPLSESQYEILFCDAVGT
ncbi:iron-containing alcohol dehydrogenase [Pseudomaricurvus alkylphenolicus]|jgi:alcohol dehydrogenase class IV|uniref:iron-containing alcohol dehydrogenase n=1 Tax=Pseudomaricurvus alkylphenolicus TaxID=1306991 RepID=UPI0014236B70|nr:iron-containing alcohol dehydrogenase [Pseudomaricurvus alkylphenolicus]NIB43904.1 iron-containing alcohol dehydrogenase [Pseudomaricurvus alkylphenolicus]